MRRRQESGSKFVLGDQSGDNEPLNISRSQHSCDFPSFLRKTPSRQKDESPDRMVRGFFHWWANSRSPTTVRPEQRPSL
jgi:hypothetical protein